MIEKSVALTFILLNAMQSTTKLHKRAKASCAAGCRRKRFTTVALILGVLLLTIKVLLGRRTDGAGGHSVHDKRSIRWSYEQLQSAIDEYTSGSWVGDKWNSSSPFSLDGLNQTNTAVLQAFESVGRNLTIGFMGDSTTRSDLRAWEEEFKCPRTNLDEQSVFQKLKQDGSYVCDAGEQTVNLTKCLIPPIVNLTNCPGGSGLSFRYFYKIYPWTPLDEWYLERPDLFQDIDVLIISMGRWFGYWYGPLNVTRDTETFLTQLRKVYSGRILYQSEYASHTIPFDESSKEPVNCPHDVLVNSPTNKYVCAKTTDEERPQRDYDIRSVTGRLQLPYLDRWNVSSTLPNEYYASWLCGKAFHSWGCDHHLGFVAMEHMRLIAHVLKILFR